MSDTPRTDAQVQFVLTSLAAEDCESDLPYYVVEVFSDFARGLERELAEIQEFPYNGSSDTERKPNANQEK